jgi:hypothetical protein
MTYVFHIDPRNAQGPKDELGAQVAYLTKMAAQAPKALLVAIPNAGKRSAWEARQRAREGLVKGFPDMLVMFNGRTLGLEFKSGTGQPSDAQIETLNKMHRLGFPVGIFRSAETALDWTRQHIPDAFTA